MWKNGLRMGKACFPRGFHLIIFSVSIERRNDQKQLVDLLCFNIFFFCIVDVAVVVLVSHSLIALQFSNLKFHSIDERVVTFVVARRPSI